MAALMSREFGKYRHKSSSIIFISKENFPFELLVVLSDTCLSLPLHHIVRHLFFIFFLQFYSLRVFFMPKTSEKLGRKPSWSFQHQKRFHIPLFCPAEVFYCLVWLLWDKSSSSGPIVEAVLINIQSVINLCANNLNSFPDTQLKGI